MIKFVKRFVRWIFSKWVVLSLFCLIVFALLFWGSYIYLMIYYEEKQLMGPERDDFGYPYTNLEEIAAPSFEDLPDDRMNLHYCENYECRYVKEPNYGVIYREFVCPQYDGEYLKHKDTNRQIRVYYELITAFLDFIKTVKSDIPMSERYLIMFNSALEVMREDGIPMPWHIDVDFAVRAEILGAAQQQGLVGKKFGQKWIKKLRALDMADEVHLSREKRPGYDAGDYHGWGDDGGFNYGGHRGTSGTRLQFEAFRIVGDEIAIGFWNDTPENRKKGVWMPKEWFYPAETYKYMGFELYGPRKMIEYLVDQYGEKWSTPLVTCDPATRKWVKNFDYVARY